jgi:hypothetical protein
MLFNIVIKKYITNPALVRVYSDFLWVSLSYQKSRDVLHKRQNPWLEKIENFLFDFSAYQMKIGVI